MNLNQTITALFEKLITLTKENGLQWHKITASDINNNRELYNHILGLNKGFDGLNFRENKSYFQDGYIFLLSFINTSYKPIYILYLQPDIDVSISTLNGEDEYQELASGLHATIAVFSEDKIEAYIQDLLALYIV